MTAPAARMDDVVGLVGPFLRERGFRKQRHAFARAVDHEVVQAIAFQMGRFEPAEERRRTTQHRPAAERLVGWAQGLGLDVSMEDATIVGMLERERAEWR